MLECALVPIHEFHCGYIKNKSTGNKSKLFLIDTDSLVQKIETKNVYEDFSKNKELFGFNNHSAKPKY